MDDQDRSALRPGRAERAVRIARDELRQLRELSTTVDALEAEIADLVAEVAPQLLAEPGFGPLTAGKLIGEIAGAERFASDAKLARAGGIAPIPVSSGKTNRHRLDRGGNRQINTAIHRVAVTRARCEDGTEATVGSGFRTSSLAIALAASDGTTASWPKQSCAKSAPT